MAVNDSDPAEDAQAQTDLNPFAIKAIKEGIAEQADRQESFQTTMRIKGDPDPEATEEFQQELIQFIKHHLSEGEVSLPEAAIALWDEVNRMEEHVRNASQKTDGKDLEEDEDESNTSVEHGDSVEGLVNDSCSEADDDGESVDAASDRNDPAFH